MIGIDLKSTTPAGQSLRDAAEGRQRQSAIVERIGMVAVKRECPVEICESLLVALQSGEHEAIIRQHVG